MLNKSSSLLFVACAFLVGAVACQEVQMKSSPLTGSAHENMLKEPTIETFTLQNGLKVFMVVDRTAPLVAVDVNYHVGSRNEKTGSTGFAHLFEHMMFQGSEHYNDDYFKPLQDIGGQVNGATGTDRTRYWEIVPSPYLERALWLESDRMGWLPGAISDESLANQKSVVQNERRQNYDNRPYGTVWEKMARVLYPPSHPYSWLTIGSMEDIGAATKENVLDFFRTWYTPNNATLAIVGDIDIENTKELVQKYFGAIPPGPAVSSIARWPVTLDHDVVLDIDDRVQLPRVWMTWPTVPAFDVHEAAMDVFGRVLGGGRTSRMYQELIYRRQIAQDAMAGQRSSQIAGVFDVVLTPRPGVDPVELEGLAMDVLSDALQGGITQAELDRVKVQVASDFVRGIENIGGFGGLADQINAYQHYLGKPDCFRMDLQRYLDLTVQDVNNAARRYLTGPRVVARVRPAGDLAAADADGVDRTGLPARGGDRPFDLPDRQSFELANGLKIVVVPQSRLPLVGLMLLVPGGSSANPSGRLGLASLLANLLSEGAGGRDATAFAEAVEDTGGSLQAEADADFWYVGGSVLTSRLPDLLGLLGDMVVEPSFPADELERQRAERLTMLRQSLDMPMFNASMAAIRAVFGKHPYGYPQLGTPTDVLSITNDDVRAMYGRWFRPEDSVLVVVGDVTMEDMRTLAGATLGRWKAPAERMPALAVEPTPVSRSFTVVDMPGAQQSVVMVAAPGPARSYGDTAAIEVLNTALGGSFVSRLNLNLREDKGYTYGARTMFDMRRAGGIVMGYAQVQTEFTAATVTEMLKELDGIGGSRPLTDAELAYARDSIVNGYAGRFATIDKIAAELVDTYAHNLPEDSVETFPGQVAVVTSAQVTTQAARWLATDQVSIIVAGDASKVLDQLRSLGLPVELVVVDREGNRVK